MSGPSVEAVEAEQVPACPDEDMLDEASWQLFAQGAAADAVASTLTLPIIVAPGRWWAT